MKTVCLWSGGKDSVYACHQARSSGQDIRTLLTFLDEGAIGSRSHGISAQVIQRQAQAIGIPLVAQAMSLLHFEEDFKKLVFLLKEHQGLEAMVFGDIHLQEHKAWIERFCRETKIVPLMPLWGKNPRKLAEAMIAGGFKAVVVSTRADVLGEEWLGRAFDQNFLETLPDGTDPLGENGEFHTLVYDGPLFDRPLRFHPGAKRKQEGHWFLEIILDEQAGEDHR